MAVPQESRDSDIAIVGSLDAERLVDGLNGLPRGIAVVGALVHVDAADVVGRTVQVEVHAPQCGAEGVREAWRPLVVQAVRLA